MPRGIAYGNTYDHYLIVDQSQVAPFDQSDQHMEDWADFKRNACAAFGVDYNPGGEWKAKHVKIIGQSYRFDLVIDYTGDAPALALVPQWYTRGDTGNVFWYKIDRDARRGFNKLIKMYPAGSFARAISWLHGYPVETYDY